MYFREAANGSACSFFPDIPFFTTEIAITRKAPIPRQRPAITTACTQTMHQALQMLISNRRRFIADLPGYGSGNGTPSKGAGAR
jgi:hypothetical protein